MEEHQTRSTISVQLSCGSTASSGGMCQGSSNDTFGSKRGNKNKGLPDFLGKMGPFTKTWALQVSPVFEPQTTRSLHLKSL